MKHLIGLIDDRVPDIVSVYSVREERVFLLDATHGQDIRLVHEIAQTAWSCNENIATLSELFERDSLGKTAVSDTWAQHGAVAHPTRVVEDLDGQLALLGFGAASFLALPIKRDRMGIIPTHCDSDCLPVCATATTSLPSRIAGMQQQGGDLHLRTAKGSSGAVALDGEGRCCETLHVLTATHLEFATEEHKLQLRNRWCDIAILAFPLIDPSSAVPVGVTAAPARALLRNSSLSRVNASNLTLGFAVVSARCRWCFGQSYPKARCSLAADHPRWGR
ncbi:hypothetical protein KC348_g65 [Hortaea werneckii]|nr:hypothetical protein KC348_g65 [Hortaea werneckii]